MRRLTSDARHRPTSATTCWSKPRTCPTIGSSIDADNSSAALAAGDTFISASEKKKQKTRCAASRPSTKARISCANCAIRLSSEVDFGLTPIQGDFSRIQSELVRTIGNGVFSAGRAQKSCRETTARSRSAPFVEGFSCASAQKKILRAASLGMPPLHAGYCASRRPWSASTVSARADSSVANGVRQRRRPSLFLSTHPPPQASALCGGDVSWPPRRP